MTTPARGRTIGEERKENGEQISKVRLLQLSPKFQKLKGGWIFCPREYLKNHLDRLKDELEGLLDSGDLSKAEHLVSNHAKIELGIGAGIDLFVDEELNRVRSGIRGLLSVYPLQSE